MHSDEHPLFELRSSPIQGKGAFALRRIPKGTRLIEYTGEKISNREADKRYDDEKMNRHHTFLFTLNDRYVVDAAIGGNDSRFINHSCDPNCEAVIERGHIYIDALRDIPEGAELAYDYAYERSDDHGDDDEELYLCRCGARNCRGTILAPPPTKRRRSSRTRRKPKRTTNRKAKRKSDRTRKRKTKRTVKPKTKGTVKRDARRTTRSRAGQRRTTR